eukprot:1178774-Prorocentrum_minimum.AAC.2
MKAHKKVTAESRWPVRTKTDGQDRCPMGIRADRTDRNGRTELLSDGILHGGSALGGPPAVLLGGGTGMSDGSAGRGSCRGSNIPK